MVLIFLPPVTKAPLRQGLFLAHVYIPKSWARSLPRAVTLLCKWTEGTLALFAEPLGTTPPEPQKLQGVTLSPPPAPSFVVDKEQRHHQLQALFHVHS